MRHLKRRIFFKKFLLGLGSLSFSFPGWGKISYGKTKEESLPVSGDPFAGVNDRVWLGEKYWAIPMEDWALKNGRIEFYGVQRNSRVNILTSVLEAGDGDFRISADMGLMQAGGKDSAPGAAGFGVGITDELDSDVKASCYFGKGTNAGISTEGFIFIGKEHKPLPTGFQYHSFGLTLSGRRKGNVTEMVLVCRTKDGAETRLTYRTPADVSGLVTLVNNFGKKGGQAFWFQHFQINGNKISEKPENRFGPVLWSMYTLSKGTLRLTAQMPPLGEKDNNRVELYLKRDGKWQSSGVEQIHPASRTVIFQLTGWDPTKDVPYELLYKNNGEEWKYAGTIRHEPVGKTLRFGGLTCQHASAFPYTPLVKNLRKYDPDILYFSGDQLYEGNGGYPIRRTPEEVSILSYLGKWYMFGWAFGDMMRDRPTICTPDDHDVFHGNLWGEGGELIPLSLWEKNRDAHGGYVQSAQMINVVGTTQCGHLPAPYRPAALPSGINTWYTDLVYGKVSFAIISDRMFKSGPDRVRDVEGRRDHITEPIGANELEARDLEFLGEGQMKFLNDWVNDWHGADMKVLLSQTLFCGVGTHHGPKKMFLYGDMDSGGWPKQKRDEALTVVRKAFAFHINGDQHLPFLVQYSLDENRDGAWAFCTPAISTGYIRWGQPDAVNAPFTDRPAHGLPNTGLYRDVFGNVNYIYAVGNPKDDYANKNRYVQAQNKSSGFGIITFDTVARTIQMDAYRFLADKDKPSENDQFPGWPLTIHQADNDGRTPTGYLPRVNVNKPDQVIKVLHEKDGDLVSVLRIKGVSYSPPVYREGPYTVIVGEGSRVKEIKGLKPEKGISERVINVSI